MKYSLRSLLRRLHLLRTCRLYGSTVQSSELPFEGITPDACSYLHQIRNIPNLTTSRFRYHVINVMDPDSSGLHTFLSTHATHLRVLRLDLYTDVAQFAQLASTVALPVDTLALWVNVVKGYTDRAMYEDAYASLMSTPYEKLHAAFVCYFNMFARKWDCVSQLTYWMCRRRLLPLVYT